jgi:hypothetical protein
MNHSEKVEMTQEQKAAQAARLSAYANAREVWAFRDPEKITVAAQSEMYERLTKLWFSMTGQEQKIAGTDACSQYH